MRTFLGRSVCLLALLAALPVFTGCKTQVCDARGPSDECEVHHALMESVKMAYAPHPVPPLDYLRARVEFFPHAYPFALPEKCPQTMVYVCDDCVKAEAAWNQWRASQKK